LLIGTRVRLRMLTKTDVEEMAAWDDDAEIEKYIGKKFAPYETPLEWYSNLLKDNRQRGLAIETLDGQFIGDVGLQEISWRKRSAEVRICIADKEYWGRGYGTEALQILIRYAFEELGLEVLYLRVYADNLRAIRCYEKCGFEKKGRVRFSSRGNGDLLLMILDRRRWRGQRELAKATG